MTEDEKPSAIATSLAFKSVTVTAVMVMADGTRVPLGVVAQSGEWPVSEEPADEEQK